LEDVSKYSNLKIAKNIKQLEKYTRHTHLIQDIVIYREDMVGVFIRKSRVVVDKPVFIGATVLDLSKMLLFGFWYKLKDFYESQGKKIRLMYTDTDSLLYWVMTENLEDDLKKMKKDFDFHKLPKDHPLYNSRNKMIPGKFKLEHKGEYIQEAVALGPKCKAVQVNNESIFKSSGVNNEALKHQLTFDHYKRALKASSTEGIPEIETHRIKSVNHIVQTVKDKRRALAIDNQTRYELDCGIDSLPYGHPFAKENKI
jgi:hypothetical protein